MLLSGIILLLNTLTNLDVDTYRISQVKSKLQKASGQYHQFGPLLILHTCDDGVEHGQQLKSNQVREMTSSNFNAVATALNFLVVAHAVVFLKLAINLAFLNFAHAH
ncbi:uncharacterized protein C8R40DRAFT_1123220 [Lentinula edodes]|uniref:uncharacterized protein n=1 Tax=Lentinula edodes TaxID=5353 RepID=UPI001E8EDB4E|nr:uncharacterized protein C8R40DRAFT_1123220 [Lentinula edodes]KAH7871210.1 hypothetical protein C8R40DRAFT_1123220 [Lentinula edodes]